VADSAIGVGLIGFGMAGQIFHAPTITATPGLKLAAIFVRSGDRARELYPSTRVVRSLEELLSDPAVELVVVATPTHSHFSLAKACLQAGRHVVVDKPFTASSEQAKELIGLARSANRVLSVYQNRRWDCEYLTAAKLLQSGVLGELLEYESHYDRYRPQLGGSWKDQDLPGCGMIFDLGSHLIDAALTLLGVPQAITAEVWTQRPNAVVNDAFDLRLHYPRVRARLKVSMLNAENGARMALHGTLGSYVKFGLDVQEEALKRGERPGTPGWGEEPKENWGVLHTVRDGQEKRERLKSEPGNYLRYYENLRDALRGVSPLAVTGEQACRTIRTVELALESSRLRRTVDWREA